VNACGEEELKAQGSRHWMCVDACGEEVLKAQGVCVDVCGEEVCVDACGEEDACGWVGGVRGGASLMTPCIRKTVL